MDRDLTDELVAAVERAHDHGQAIMISGAGSKAFLCRSADDGAGRLVSTTEHRGIVDYLPDELVVTARSGTPLRDLRQTLARANQMLAFEPPAYSGLGTLGGAVACGLAGPGRPWRGNVRDSVLGVVLVNGLGQKLRFGGQVVKNVAGYDVSRLQAGVFGTLGLLLEISLRVMPMPQAEQTRLLAVDAADALVLMRHWARQALPVTAACHVDGVLSVRLAGAAPAVKAAAQAIGGDTSHDVDFWDNLNHMQLPFFRQPGALWRQIVAPATVLQPGWDGLIDWAGGKRWTRRDEQATSAASPDADGGAIQFGSGYARQVCTNPGGNGVVAEYQRRIKAAFDPDNILNPEIFDADRAA